MNKRAVVLAAGVAAIANASARAGGSDRRFRPTPEEAMATPEDEIKRSERADDLLPDRISIERPNEFYDPVVSELGVRIDGVEQDSVVEYCRSAGWARIGERDAHGKLIWEYDHYRARRVEDVVIEPYWKRPISRQQRRALASRQRKGGR